MQNGALVVSLDFELLWGVFDKVDWKQKNEYFNNTRQVIPEILQFFEKYDIACTWATVGMLFNENWDEWNANIPQNLPEYDNENLSAYKYGKSIQAKETEKLCFAPDLIRKIAATPNQEIGTHTYSHYYCLEPGQDIEAFREDLGKAKELAEAQDVELKSLVFPRNQFNSNYLEVCKEVGLKAVRTNPDAWYWRDTQKDSLQQKIFRTGDAYVGFNNKSYNKISEIHTGISGQKASRLLRPHSGKAFPDQLRIKRIISEMISAAKKGEIYHLWWHPHNFGGNPDANLSDLNLILRKFEELKNKYHFQSMNMEQVKNIIKPRL